MRRNVFVASAHRSGSTLMTLVLGSHPLAFDVGEFGAFPDWIAHPDGSRCTCGAAPFVACPFWAEVAAQVWERTGWDPFTQPYARLVELRGRSALERARMRALRSLYLASRRSRVYAPLFQLVGGPARVEEMVEATLALYDAALEVAGAELLVDSHKEPARYRALVAARPESRIVYLTRDGRGVVASHLTSKRPSRAYHYRSSAAARRWVEQNRGFQRMLSTLPRESWMHVRYEDLCAHPQETLERVCAFLEVPFDPGMLDFSEQVHHTVGGNRMRFRGDRAIRLDERWRRRLTDEDLQAYDRIAGRMHRALGYAA